MNNFPPPNWNSSASSSLQAATPAQMGMALAMKSMFNSNSAAQFPSHNVNFGSALNPYHQGHFAPLNAGFRPGIQCPPTVQQNMHGFPGFPAGAAYTNPGMIMTQPPRPPNMHHRPNMNTGQYNQQQNCQGKACNKSHSQMMTPKQTFSCDACERDFISREILNTHLAAHVECEHEGCSFKATRKVLKMHRVQAHSSKKIIKLDTPEEIAKWKEERKRNYPTINNVSKKKEEEENRRASGQILNTPSYSYKSNFDNQQSHKGEGMDRGGKHRNRRRQLRRRDRNLPRNAQNQRINGNKISRQETEDSVEEERNISQSKEEHKSVDETSVSSSGGRTASSAMNLLIASYDNTSESEDENSEDENNNRAELENGEFHSRMKLNTEVTEPEPKRLKTNVSSTASSDSKRKNKGYVKEPFVRNRNKKPTLLEMLLAPEVRHERNVILQCIRHIVKNNFFDDDLR